MAKGLDINHNSTAIAKALVADGYEFIGRYYKMTPGSHPLTHAEARALSAAGLSIVAVWENGFPNSRDYFSYARGVHDGAVAYHYALTETRQPAGTPIYFTVDYDAAHSDITGGISDYFHGIRDGFHTIGRGAPAYAIGVYGSGSVCDWILSHFPAVAYAWLSLSTGWSGHNSFTTLEYQAIRRSQSHSRSARRSGRERGAWRRLQGSVGGRKRSATE